MNPNQPSSRQKAAPHLKRVQIDKTQARMLATVIGASVISMFALVAAKSYFSQANYLNKVAGKKEVAVKQLKSNKEAAIKLEASYKSFAGQSPNLIGGSATGTGERDGDNGRLILDALPSKYDFPALATSIEKLLVGYKINTINGTDDATTQSASTDSTQPIEMPFSVDVTTTYENATNVLKTFEKSIRPFQITDLSITGTNTILNLNISAKTYYQPAKDMKITSEEVK